MTFKKKPLPKLTQDAGAAPRRFIVLYRGGDGAAFLNAHTWARDNVLRVRGEAAAQPELDCPDDDCLAGSMPSGHTR
jgi:hypothetical protein